VSVEVTGVVTSAAGVQMYLMIALDTQNTFGLQYQAGFVRTFWRIANAYTDLDVVPYDPVSHRHWRVASAADQIRWDVSPDGIDWTTLGTRPAPFDLASLQIVLAAGMFAGTASPGLASFASFAVR
jgi:hypothetical protein